MHEGRAFSLFLPSVALIFLTGFEGAIIMSLKPADLWAMSLQLCSHCSAAGRMLWLSNYSVSLMCLRLSSLDISGRSVNPCMVCIQAL